MSDNKPQICIIGTGGSISTPGRNSLDLYEYSDYVKTLEVEELIGFFPELGRQYDIYPVRLKAIISPAITTQDWIEIHNKISEIAAHEPENRGIVITHGTSTIEETAYFLHLTLKIDIPVVLVGAQHPPNGLSSDAGLNLLNAIRVAISREARDLGVLVVMNDEVHSARDVTKTSNFRLHTFQSHELGILGYAEPDGSVVIYRRPNRRHTNNSEFEVKTLKEFPRVEIIYSYAGADGKLIDAAIESGSRGIVIAGMPPSSLSISTCLNE